MVIPTIYPVETVERPAYDERRDIVFIGGFAHAPNVDAVLYFAQEILPRIRARIPEALFKVIGPEPTPEISKLESPHIHVLGTSPTSGRSSIGHGFERHRSASWRA